MSTDRIDILRDLGLSPEVLKTNKHRLDEEFETHPQNMWDVCEALADAREIRDDRKRSLERMESRVRGEKDNGDKRMTVKALDAAVVQDPEVRRAQQALAEADHRVDLIAGLLDALKAKTSALKHLSELYQAGYYVASSGGRREVSTRGRKSLEDS